MSDQYLARNLPLLIPAPCASIMMLPSLRRRACDEQVASGGSLVGRDASDPLADHRLRGSGVFGRSLPGRLRRPTVGRRTRVALLQCRCISPTRGRSFPLSRANNPRRMGEPKAHLHSGLTATSRWLAQAATGGTVLSHPRRPAMAGRCISTSSSGRPSVKTKARRLAAPRFIKRRDPLSP